MESLLKLTFRKSSFVHALLVAVAFCGVLAWMYLPVDIYPDIVPDQVTILTVWPGANPEDIERLVTDKIERALSDLPHMKSYFSDTSAGDSYVAVRFVESASQADIEASVHEIRARLSRLRDWPDGCERPVVTRASLSDEPILRIAVADAGNNGMKVVTHIAKRLQTELETLPGVSRTGLLGEVAYEVQVLLDGERLEHYKLSITEVTAVLAKAFSSFPAGDVQQGDKNFPVRFQASSKKRDELEQTVITIMPDGAIVRLRDLAAVEERPKPRAVMTRFEGHPCVGLQIMKSRTAKVLQVRDDVIAKIREFEKDLPPGIIVEEPVDITVWISNAMNTMRDNLSIGCLLIFVVLWICLGIRSGIMAMVGIPFSFLCTLACMQLAGLTLNTATVFGLVLVSGLIVDDAIVVLESIHVELHKNRCRTEAVLAGTMRVMGPVVVAALTTVLAFMPIYWLQGEVGKLFEDIPLIVIIALLASLFECLILLPGHMLHLGPKVDVGTKAKKKTVWDYPVIWYQAVLSGVLWLRYVVVAGLLLVAVVAWHAWESLPAQLLPSDFPMVAIGFEVDSQESLAKTDKVAGALTEKIKSLTGPNKSVRSSLGVSGVLISPGGQEYFNKNVGTIFVQFNPVTNGAGQQQARLETLQRALAQFQQSRNNPGLKKFTVAMLGGLSSGPNVQVQLQHPDLKIANLASQHLQAALKSVPEMTNVQDTTRFGPRQLIIRPNEAKLREFGLLSDQVNREARVAIAGLVVGTVTTPFAETPLSLRVLLRKEQRDDPDHVLSLRIKAPTGAHPQLRQVAEHVYEQGPASIFHEDGKRTVTVQGRLKDNVIVDGQPIDVDYVQKQLEETLQKLKQQPAFRDLHWQHGGAFAQRQQSLGNLATAAVILGVVIYLILLWQFGSYLQPLLILTTIVFSGLGVVCGLVMHDYPRSLVTAVSLVGLFGVVVNDAIIMIDFLNVQSRTGDRTKGILTGAGQRLRPILLTTITTVLGLVPLAAGIRGRSEVWSPFAVCFCYGLTAATLLTLLVTPCLYMIIDDLRVAREFVQRRLPWGKKQTEDGTRPFVGNC